MQMYDNNAIIQREKHYFSPNTYLFIEIWDNKNYNVYLCFKYKNVLTMKGIVLAGVPEHASTLSQKASASS